MLKRESPFAKSRLGQKIADMTDSLHTRPSVMLGIEGSPLEMLLWDMAILGEKSPVEVDVQGAARRLVSVRDKVLAKRRRLGIPRYVS